MPSKYDILVEPMIGSLPGSVAEKLANNMTPGVRNLAQNIFDNYLNELMGNINQTAVTDRYGHMRPPDELFMRQVEEGLSPGNGGEDWRRSIAAFVGHLALKNTPIHFDNNPQLKSAILHYIVDHMPEELQSALNSDIKPKKPKYHRSITDPWEPSW